MSCSTIHGAVGVTGTMSRTNHLEASRTETHGQQFLSEDEV